MAPPSAAAPAPAQQMSGEAEAELEQRILQGLDAEDSGVFNDRTFPPGIRSNSGPRAVPRAVDTDPGSRPRSTSPRSIKLFESRSEESRSTGDGARP